MEPNAQYGYVLDNVTSIIDKTGGRMPADMAPTVAVAQATLALVYEQRTANLIAVLNSRPDILRAEERAALAGEIKRRLGL